MDWKIRVIEGPDKGLEQPLAPGPNIIGRGKAAAVRLNVGDVSWEHAAVIREQDQCFLENLSALGTWVGDARVNTRVRLRSGDKFRLSEETVLRVDSAAGAGLSRGTLIMALVVMLLLLGVVAYYQILAASNKPEHWDVVYNKLLPWMQTQVNHHQLPPESLEIFRSAWTHTVTKDYPAGLKLWVRLQIALDSPQAKIHCMELAEKDNKRSVGLLFNPPPDGTEPTDEEYAAALGTFVNTWLGDAIEKTSSGLTGLKPN